MEVIDSVRTIMSHFENYGWDFHQDEQGRIVTGWQGSSHSYPLIVSISDTIVTFEVTPMLEINLNWEEWPEVTRYLLELNDRSTLVRVSIGDNGYVNLSCHLMNSSIQYDQFTKVVGVIGYYCDLIREELVEYMSELGLLSFQSTPYLS